MEDWKRLREIVGEEKFDLIELVSWSWACRCGKDLRDGVYEDLIGFYEDKENN